MFRADSSSFKETLATFAANFVVPEFRERFIHEALKKPQRLHQRICHRIETVFPVKYQGATALFSPDEACLLIGWGQTVIEKTSWSEVEKTSWSEVEKMKGAGGILVLDISGRKFYAETEGEPRIQVWGGAC